jgi:hypothetical protein
MSISRTLDHVFKQLKGKTIAVSRFGSVRISRAISHSKRAAWTDRRDDPADRKLRRAHGGDFDTPWTEPSWRWTLRSQGRKEGFLADLAETKIEYPFLSPT